MKKTLLISFAIALLSHVICLPLGFAQGTLTPPGAPAQTMKSLDQIEARIPISSAPYIITNSGSYYLTGNLTVGTNNAITIRTNDVSLDLNGFTIRSTCPVVSGYGIQLLDRGLNIIIRNGNIRGGVTNASPAPVSGGGFAYGIGFVTTYANSVLVSQISVSGCGQGIILNINNGTATVVDSCAVVYTIGTGIKANVVKNSAAMDCGGDAIIASSAMNCNGIAASSGIGITAQTAMNCAGESNTGTGLKATVVTNCRGESNSGNGISGNSVINSYGSTLGNSGINALTVSFSTANGDRAIQATNATGSYAASGTNLIVNRYNMPP